MSATLTGRRLTARDVMTSPVATMPPLAPVKLVAELMLLAHVSGVLRVDTRVTWRIDDTLLGELKRMPHL